MRHVLNDQLAPIHSHGALHNAKPAWKMQSDWEEHKLLCRMSTGGLMVTQQIYYYDQDHNHVKVAISHYSSIQSNERQDTKDTYVQAEILLMDTNIREYQLINVQNVLIQYSMGSWFDLS